MTGPGGYIVRKWTGSSRATETVRGMTIYGGAVLPLQIRTVVGATSNPPPTLKPRVAGLVIVCDTLKGATSVNNSQLNNGINHVMIRIGWNKLQPDTTGNPAVDSLAFDWSFLDSILNSATTGTLFKIGVDAGAAAPNWLKTATGTVDVWNTKDQVMATCPLWWTDTAHNAWSALQQAMGARYDADPRILQVIASGSMAVYMEPWILGSDTPSGIRLFNAGLTTLTMTQASIERTLRETIAAWPTTRVEMPIHGQLQYPYSGGVKNLSWTASRDWFNPLAAEFADQMMVTDYGVGPSDVNPYGGSIGSTSALVAAGSPVTSIPVNALAGGLASGAKILLPIGQVVTLSGSVSAGATALPVTSFTPTVAIASGATLYNAPATTDTITNSPYQYGWMWLRGKGQGPVAYQLTLGTFSVANEKAAAENCIALGGCYSETSGWNGIVAADRLAYDTALKAQAG
jgi:hypothetical protein